MKRTPAASFLRHAAGWLGAGCLLTACGGGGDSLLPEVGNPISQVQAEAAGVNGAVMPTEGIAALSTALALTRWLITGQASQTIPCNAGGSAAFTVSGTVPLLLGNQRFDTDEHYAITFNQCRHTPGGSVISGALTLDVRDAAGADYTVAASAQNLVVTRPGRTLRLSGSSVLTYAEVASGSTVVSTERWVSPSYTLASTRGSRTSSFSLSQVDLTRTETRVNGTVVGSTSNGTATLAADLPNFNFSVTLATTGDVTFNANGEPLRGDWALVLPRDTLRVSVLLGGADLRLDLGSNGSTDLRYLSTVSRLLDELG